MADNVTIPATGTGSATPVIAADEATYSGDTSKIQVVRLVHVSGSEGSKTVAELIRAEDAGHTTGDPGMPILAVRQDVLAPLATTDIDYIPLTTDKQGRLNVSPGNTVIVSASKTRPSDTNVYAAGDVLNESTSVGTVSTFANCARVNGGSGHILGGVLIDSGNQTTKPNIELWIFDTTITADNDNAVFTPTDAELETVIGVIAFDAAYVGDATAGTGNCVLPGGLRGSGALPFVTGAASKDLFGVLVVRNAYTPISAEKFTVRLFIAQD